MDSGIQMFERLTESEAQSCKSAKMRPHAQIGPLDMGSADVFQLRVSGDWYWDRRGYFGGVVPLGALGTGLPVKFEQLCEVNACSEVFFDCIPVDAKAIRRDLESANNALAQVADKFEAIGSIPLAEIVSRKI